MTHPIEYYSDKIVLGERLFTINSQQGIIYESATPANCLAFKDMLPLTQAYGLAYNDITHKITGFEPVLNEHIRMIYIPKNLLHHFQEFTAKQKEGFIWSPYVGGEGYSLLGEAFENRLKGNVPVVIHKDITYAVDADQNRLIYSPHSGIIDQTKTINFNDLMPMGERGYLGPVYVGFYKDEPHHLITSPMESIHDFEGTMGLMIEEIRRLDPVGTALKENKAPYVYLVKHPLINTHYLIEFDPTIEDKLEFIKVQKQQRDLQMATAAELPKKKYHSLKK